jgi:hypothetical protein
MTAEMLRAKYGPPQGSKFTISPGFEIVVEWEPDGQVRRIEFPRIAPDAMGASTAQRVDEVLLELVPISMRGKELGSGVKRFGISTKNTYYEHVMIIEVEDPWVPGQRRSVTVFFTAYYQSNSIS